jgi:hypothetical protein
VIKYDAIDFHDVSVYTSDNIYEAAIAYMRNLVITTDTGNYNKNIKFLNNFLFLLIILTFLLSRFENLRNNIIFLRSKIDMFAATLNGFDFFKCIK